MTAPVPSPNTERRPDWAALVIALLLAAIAIVIVIDVQRVVGIATYSRIGPAVFPYGVATGLTALAAWTAVAAWRGDFPERPPIEAPPVLWIIAGLLAQVLLLNTAGFAIATGMVFAFTARGFGRGPLWLTIPIGAAFALALYLAFTKGLQLSLPAGPVERLF